MLRPLRAVRLDIACCRHYSCAASVIRDNIKLTQEEVRCARRLADGLPVVLMAFLRRVASRTGKSTIDFARYRPDYHRCHRAGQQSLPPPAVLSKEDVTVREGQVTERHSKLDSGARRSSRSPARDRDRRFIAARSFGNQLQPLSRFCHLAASFDQVGVFYAANGTIQIASQFQSGPCRRSRRPSGCPARTYGAASSIYQSLMQLIGGWPVTGARREFCCSAMASTICARIDSVRTSSSQSTKRSKLES